MRGVAPAQVKGRMGFALLWGTNIANYVVGSALVFWLGSLLFGNGTLTLGSVYLIWYYVSMTRDPMDADPDPDGGLPEGGRRHRPRPGAVRHRGPAHLDG